MLPHIKEVVGKFGKPCAIVRDLGQAVSKAVGELASQMDPQPRVLACHQHFLRDVGKDLLKQEYNQLRALFRNLVVISKLGWIRSPERVPKWTATPSENRARPRVIFLPVLCLLRSVSQSWGRFGSMGKGDGGPLLTERNIP
jgi:hypothetical protein